MESEESSKLPKSQTTTLKTEQYKLYDVNGRKKKNEGNGTAEPVGHHQVDQHWHQRDPNVEVTNNKEEMKNYHKVKIKRT